MKYVSPHFSKGQKIEYDSKRRSYRGYTSVGRKGVIEFTDCTRDYYYRHILYKGQKANLKNSKNFRQCDSYPSPEKF